MFLCLVAGLLLARPCLADDDQLADSGNVTAILGNPANLHCSVRVVMERGMAVSLKENLDVTLLLPAGQ